MRKEVTQKQKDQWQKTREKGVKKYQERIKAKQRVYKKRRVLKSKAKKKTYIIAKKSTSQNKRDKLYLPVKRVFLRMPENEMCNMRISPECIKERGRTVDVHHKKGKCGDLYWDIRFFLATCRICHDYELNHDAEAKEKGVSLLRLIK